MLSAIDDGMTHKSGGIQEWVELWFKMEDSNVMCDVCCALASTTSRKRGSGDVTSHSTLSPIKAG